MLLGLWALALWGSLLLLLTALDVPTLGLAGALGRLRPAVGGGPWGWVNLLSTFLAVVLWLAGAAVLAVRLRRRPQ